MKLVKNALICLSVISIIAIAGAFPVIAVGLTAIIIVALFLLFNNNGF